MYRTLTNPQRLSIVKLNKEWNLSPTKISALTGVKRSTVVELLIAYDRNGTHESQKSKF